VGSSCSGAIATAIGTVFKKKYLSKLEVISMSSLEKKNRNGSVEAGGVE
jgi:hypothetical protein